MVFGAAAGARITAGGGLQVTNEGAACAGSGLGLSDIQLPALALFVAVWGAWAVAAWMSGKWCLRRAIAEGSLGII